MHKILITVLLLYILLPFSLSAQPFDKLYVKYSEGKGNLYSKPDTQSEVIGEIEQFDIIADASSICGLCMVDSIPEGWQAVADYRRNSDGDIGYLKRQELRTIDGYNGWPGFTEMKTKRYPDLMLIEHNSARSYSRYRSDADSILFGDSQKGVFLSMERCDSTKFEVMHTKDGDFPSIYGHNIYEAYGVWFKGAIITAMKEFSILWQGERCPLSEELLHQYIFSFNFLELKEYSGNIANPTDRYISAYEGEKGEIYVCLWGGDAAGAFYLLWVIHNGKLVSQYAGYAC